MVLCLLVLAGAVQPALAAAKRQSIAIGNEQLSKLAYTPKPVSLEAKAKTRLVFESSKPKVATVTKKGALRLKKAGTTKIVVQAEATRRYRAARRTISVKVVRAKQLITTPSYKERLLKDGSYKIKTGIADDAAVSFSSSNSAIATVDEKGKVELGGGIGRTTITIRAARTPRYRAAKKRVTLRVTRYRFLFEKSKSIGTFPLSRLLKGLTGQRLPEKEGLFTCDELAPQGVCVADGRLYLTAYCKFHDGGAVRHNSLLHILDASTLKTIKTIVLPATGNNHVGGVTVDDDGNVLVAGATTMRVLLIKKETLDGLLADDSSGTVVLDAYDSKKMKATKGSSVSFVEYADGLLWVGYYVHDARSYIYAYSIESGKNGPKAITLQHTYKVASDANGVSIFTRGGTRYLAVSRQPNGRNGYSEILFYEDLVAGGGTGAKLVGGASFPCQIEEIDFDSKMRMYVVYESASKTYRTGSDGVGVANEVVRYGTVGNGAAIFRAALKLGPQ